MGKKKKKKKKKKKGAGSLDSHGTNKTCRNSGCFNHKRNNYFVNSTEKSDRFQVILLITGIYLQISTNI